MHKLIGINQLEIATKIKKSRPCITNVVSGVEKTPSIQKAIADIYGVPVHELFENNEQKKD